MSSVTHFTQHILRLDPQKSAARQLLFHYLKFFRDRDEELNASLILDFYRFVLNFNHWQEHSLDLGREVAALLASFAQQQGGLRLKELRHSDQLQVVRLSHSEDLEDLINRNHTLNHKPGLKHKILRFDDTQAISLTLHPQGGLRVRKFAPLAVIVEGGLELLSPLTDLHYTAQLDLENGTSQTLEGGHTTLSRFVVTGHGIQGTVLRGHNLQKYESLSGMSLALYPEVYHALKKVERFYIKPESDPFYQELIALLEKVYQTVSLKGPHYNPKAVESALQKGKAALKNIFPNDKLLLLLVTNIEYHLLSTGAPWEKPQSPSV